MRLKPEPPYVQKSLTYLLSPASLDRAVVHKSTCERGTLLTERLFDPTLGQKIIDTL